MSQKIYKIVGAKKRHKSPKVTKKCVLLGLSASAGFTYSGERFRRHFADFENKYGFHDMYSGGFCRYDTPEEHWAYWSRFITINRYMDAPKPICEEIFEIVKDKDYALR